MQGRSAPSAAVVFFVVLAAGIPRPSLALDPNSLHAVKEAGPADVLLSWTDATPTVYCVHRALTAPPAAIVGSTSGPAYPDAPPPATLWFYRVEEPVSGSCTGTLCAAAGTLSCGQSIAGARNDAAGSTDVVDSYPSCSVFDATGPEYAYLLTPDQDLDLTIALASASPDLFLFVLEDRGAGCDPGACIAAGADSVTVPALAGVPLHVVVDGRAGAAASYDLQVSGSGTRCTPAGAIVCGTPVAGDNAGPGSTRVLESYAPCALAGATGPEYAYVFTAAVDATVTAMISGMTADLDLAVLADQGHGCATTDCLDSGDTAVTFAAAAGETYYLVVDGIAGAESAFTLSLDCGAPPVADCAPARPAICGTTTFGSNDDPGSTDAIDAYPSCASPDESGPEYVYSFTATASGAVTLALSSSADLDLLVLAAPPGGACRADDCVSFGDSGTAFDAVAGETYYLVVDGRGGDAGGYVLGLTCDLPPGGCSPVYPLGCGEAHFWNNANPGSTDVNGSYSCAAADESGPEYTYVFTPPEPGSDFRVTAYLELMTADLDVFALAEGGGGCDAGSCVAWGDTEVAFDALAGESYYFSVDGRGGEIGDYRIRLECSLAPEPCRAGRTVACGDALAGESNGQPGSTDVIDTYASPCLILRPLDESGPEYAYSFTAPSSGMVEVTLTGVTGTPHLFVLESRGSGCDSDACVAFSTGGSVSFPATAGTTYYVLVEGFLGSVATYDIDFACR